MKIMKTGVKNLFMFLLLCFISVNLSAQINGNGHVISKTFDLHHFDRISVGGSFQVILTQSTDQQVVIQVDENLLQRIEVTVVDGTLQLSTRSMQNPTKLVAEIHVASLASLDASGATDVSTTAPFNGANIEIEASGASDISFNGNFTKMEIDLSGASKLTLVGKAQTMHAEISGASDLKAADFEVGNASVEASGASNATVNVTENLNADESGASDIHNSYHRK